MNRIHNLFCRTSLHWAAAMGHQDCVLILLKLEVKPNVVDMDGVTPLDYTRQTGHKGKIQNDYLKATVRHCDSH